MRCRDTYTLMLENIKFEYSETNKSRYAINVTNPTEHTIRCALRAQNFGLEFSALIVNRRSGVFQFPLPKGDRMCMCDPLRMLHRTPSKIGFIEGFVGIGGDWIFF